MIRLTRPSDRAVAAHLARVGDRPLSYGASGLLDLDSPPSGYDIDRHRVRLGTGRAAFARARDAVRRWTMFEVGWAEVRPEGAPIVAGTVVGVLAHWLGAWTLNPARILRVIDEPSPSARFGFVYGSLPGHFESGEERFLVGWDGGDDGPVWYDLSGISRPGNLLGRLSYPLLRRAQQRFAADSQRAMARAVSDVA